MSILHVFFTQGLLSLNGLGFGVDTVSGLGGAMV